MRPYDGGVDHVELVADIARQELENPCRHAAFSPSTIAPVGRSPAPVAFRQITPRNAGTIAVDDGIDEQPIVGSRPADVSLSAGQEILDPLPLVVGKRVAMHVSAPRLPTTHESERM